MHNPFRKKQIPEKKPPPVVKVWMCETCNKRPVDIHNMALCRYCADAQRENRSMNPNTQNKKDLEALGFTYSVNTGPNPNVKALCIERNDVWCCFEGRNYQGELGAFILGWKSAKNLTT